MKCPLPILLVLTLALSLRAADQTIDWERAKALYQRSQAGEKLTDDEQKYLEEAKRQRGAQDQAMREKMRAIKEKMDNGEKLADEEQKMVEQFRKRSQGGPEMERARQLFEKKQRGETLTADEEKFLEEAKARQMNRGPDGGDFDWEAAKQAHEKKERGETLSADEEKLLDEAARRMKGGRGPGAAARPAPPAPPKDLTPLNELTAKYKDQDGGLYGGGENEPPAAHAALAGRTIAQIKPLDRDGKPSADGKIVLMSIGMSNTTQEFSTFVPKANADPRKAANVVVVDAAQGGMDATSWAGSDADTWRVAEQRLQLSGVAAAQVQAVWIKQALKGPQAGFPAETGRLRDRLREVVTIAKQKYPNLRVAYLSSRIYGGYAKTMLNPEPYAYESAFAVRWLIEEQMKGTPALNADATKGEVKAPVLLWGPYLWANGETPRKGDGLRYAANEFSGDGTHPGDAAREKVARLLLDFFTENPLAKPWFAK